MTFIKAPYNFVPLNNTVVTPYWSSYVSHDVPFVDSYSGTLEVTITAHSPIFVKDGLGQKEAEDYFNKGVQIKPFRFNQDARGKFIPGSSIKGMVRNVLEILSFGGMERKVTDRKYALRDLAGTMKEEYLAHFKPEKIYGGWLKRTVDDEYVIKDCGLPGRISHRKIDEKSGSNLSTYYGEKGGFNARKDEEKSAQKKYILFGDRSREHGFEFDHDSGGRQVYVINEASNQKGTLVFTGQPGPRKQVPDRKTGEMKWTGHHLEFIFWQGGTEKSVSSGAMNDFFDAYYEYDKTQWSDDWKAWRIKLKEGEYIPVFFSKDDKGEIIHLGLSYLYKLPFKNSVKESIQKKQPNTDKDFSETIFGYIDKIGGLKGRVHIGHAFAINDVQEGTEACEVLSGPKASYYPNYIRQEVGKNGKVTRYATFMDGKPEIAGWKRYPVHSNGVKINPAPNDNQKIQTRFVPLETGAEFKCKIRYHNLKKVELGALLSALTFHHTENTYHSLGMAKPLGYGKVKLRVESDIVQPEEYLRAFECYMNVALGNNYPEWHISDQVAELTTMSQEQNNASSSELEYMKLSMSRGDNEFTVAKNNKEALDKYSILVGKKANIHPLSTPGCIADMKRQCEEEKEVLQRLQPLKTLIPAYQAELKKAVEKKLEEQKRQILNNLQEQRTVLEEYERATRAAQESEKREARKQDQQQAIQAQGLTLDEVDPADKDAFNLLKKAIEAYGRIYHNANDKTLKDSFPNGFLPASDHEILFQKLQYIYANLSKKEGAKWRKTFNQNAVLKKIAEWVGEKKTNEIIFK